VSLRTRLVAGLLAVTAVGMLLVGVITYTEQRSFLIDRVDQQVRAASPAIDRALSERGINVPGYTGHTGRGRGPAASGVGGVEGGDGPPPGGGTPGGVGGRPGGPIDLPPGTYGQRRDATGKVLGSVRITYGQGSFAAPKLPKAIKPGKIFTVAAAGGSELRYRVLALSSDEQPGVTVVAVPMQSVEQTLDRLLLVEALVIAGVLLALALLAFWLVRLGLRPLDEMGETADAIAGGELSKRVEPANERTEVGRLGLALNAMLSRLESAFAERQASEDRLRNFIADASHELRTPLSSIRGYAELVSMGAASSEADREKAIRRIEEEAKRMGVLVDDLLTLARLDELPDAVRQDVDVSKLASDAVDDARAVDPDRTIELHADAPATVVGDPHQLRQVFANLVRNALVHTPAGTAIDVGAATRNGNVEVTVRDHGPGLPNGDSVALFERFWRSEGGRKQGKAGAGLGLAIVAVIVDAHGGTVRAQNAEGGGAQFTVELPAATPPVA
jgi:two-component system OmpR family sensor kinase